MRVDVLPEIQDLHWASADHAIQRLVGCRLKLDIMFDDFWVVHQHKDRGFQAHVLDEKPLHGRASKVELWGAPLPDRRQVTFVSLLVPIPLLVLQHVLQHWKVLRPFELVFGVVGRQVPLIMVHQVGQRAHGRLPGAPQPLLVLPARCYLHISVALPQAVAKVAHGGMTIIVDLQDTRLLQGRRQGAPLLVHRVPELQARLPQHPAGILPAENRQVHLPIGQSPVLLAHWPSSVIAKDAAVVPQKPPPRKTP